MSAHYYSQNNDTPTAWERTATTEPHNIAFFVALGALFSAVLYDIFYNDPLDLHGENREETTFSCCLLDLSFCGGSLR